MFLPKCKQKKINYLIALVLLFWAGNVAAMDYAGKTKDQDYLIGAHDIVKITVYEEPDLTKTVRITTNGMLSFPLIGSISVAGSTVTDLEHTLTRLLAEDYLVNPQVSVFIEEYHSKKVFVLGAVNKPCAYELKGNTTVLEMISRAEGITADGGSSLVLLRKISDDKSVKPNPAGKPIFIDLNNLLIKGDISQNILVQNGDVIHIPKADSIYVFGEVKNQGHLNWKIKL